MFTIKEDYLPLIREDRLGEILEADDAILAKALPAAQEEAAGFIRHRYDEGETFRSVEKVPTDTINPSTLGARYYQSTSKIFYTAITEGATDLAIPTDFEPGDNRNPKLVEVVVDIVLYNIHSRINPKSVPGHRRIRYDGDDPKQQGGALGWLKMVQKGTVQPKLPVIIDEETGTPPQNSEAIGFGQTPTTTYGF